ncbi:MAG: ABC transporter ATP-binding protein [Hyphomicrobiales bacterium]|nr:ABC transporter ATP-binding protein [Hyphomicrobiales bacterium]MBW0001958.1 ABC transporter ATP-binding protein [Hyphomicrobiales bacterium]
MVAEPARLTDAPALEEETSAPTLRLRVDRVTHQFGPNLVLDDVTLEIAPGEVLALVGPSGCGKSTLLNILGGLLLPTKGGVLIHGEPRPDCLNALTYVFQDFALLPWRTVAGNISLVLEDKLRDEKARRERISEMLRLTGLENFAHAYPKQLSGGMRQRVGIARALAVRPACLFMDEPLSALDAQTRALLLEEFALLIARAAITTVYVTHNLNEAVRLANRVVVLSRRPGRIKAIVDIDRPAELRREDDPELLVAEKTLWSMIRDEASAADRELEDAR